MQVNAPKDCDNAPRKKVIKDFNVAFASAKLESILEFMSDEIIWEMVGDQTHTGKQEVARALKKFEGQAAHQLDLDNIITHGNTASSNGRLFYEGHTIAFCDVYLFNGFKADAKIKKLQSYAIELQ